MRVDEGLLRSKYPIIPGLLFYGVLPPFQTDSHLAIVIGYEPKAKPDTAWLVYFTSSVKKSILIYRNEPEALVHFTRQEVLRLFKEPKDCVVQCGRRHLFCLKVDDIYNKTASGILSCQAMLSSELFSKIAFALHNATTIPDVFKNNIGI